VRRDSSVGIATGYGLDGPGIESRWGGEIFRTCPYRPWGPPSLLHDGYRAFPGVKERSGRDADPSPLLVPWSRKSRAKRLLPLWGSVPVQGCTSPLVLYRLYPLVRQPSAWPARSVDRSRQTDRQTGISSG